MTSKSGKTESNEFVHDSKTENAYIKKTDLGNTSSIKISIYSLNEPELSVKSQDTHRTNNYLP